MTARARFSYKQFGIPIFCVFLFSIAAFAKDKPKIIIEVVKTELNSGQYTYTTPGRQGSSQTNCNTNGSTTGTITDFGTNTTNINAQTDTKSNCTTTTTAATAPQTHVGTVTAEFVTAIMPDGSSVFLSCIYGVHRCDVLAPGKYTAEIDGNTLQVYVSDLSGRVRKVKYKALARIPSSLIQQPVSAPTKSIPPVKPSESNNSTLPSQNITLLKEKAANGDADAELQLGRLYYDGQGVPQDYAQTALLFRMAANEGDADAQAVLAALYFEGNGVPKDYNKMIEWLRKAAEQGNVGAQVSLAMTLESDEVVPHDYQQSAEWYRKAAAQGNLEAQCNLGADYVHGQGVPQDYSQAAIWYRMAAEQGDTVAQLQLGILYEHGNGVNQDYLEAYFWLNLAAAGKVTGVEQEDAVAVLAGMRKTRDDVASHLTPADLSRVQERARKWLDAHPAKP